MPVPSVPSTDQIHASDNYRKVDQDLSDELIVAIFFILLLVGKRYSSRDVD